MVIADYAALAHGQAERASKAILALVVRGESLRPFRTRPI